MSTAKKIVPKSKKNIEKIKESTPRSRAEATDKIVTTRSRLPETEILKRRPEAGKDGVKSVLGRRQEVTTPRRDIQSKIGGGVKSQSDPIRPRRVQEVSNGKDKVSKTVVSRNQISKSAKKDPPVDLELKNHTRSQTRTLLPSEVKYLDKVESPKKEKLTANPKVFYVPLDESKKDAIVKQESKLENYDETKSVSDTNSYEDDFESYESDFESCSESSQSSQETQSEEQNIAKTEERKFDSGNYELGESSTKQLDKMLESIDERVINTFELKETSLIDEGFDENSTIVFNGSKSFKTRPKSSVVVNRAKDLKQLINLDALNYSLFDMFPMRYETFISIYGKSERCQVQCQTDSDGQDEQVQTEDVVSDEKWCQCPVEYSQFVPRVAKVTVSTSDVTADPHFVKVNALEALIKQMHGTGDGSTLSNYPAGNSNPTRLSRFVDKVGRFVLEYLRSREGGPRGGEWNVIENEMYQRAIMEPIIWMSTSQGGNDCFITFHQGNHFREGLLCLWNFRGSLVEPLALLSTPSSVSSCSLHPSSGLAVAGSVDGNICVWDLNEDEAWHRDPKDLASCARKCSYHSGGRSSNMHLHGSTVDVLFLEHGVGSSVSINTLQVLTLQELGLVTIWTVVNKLGGPETAKAESAFGSCDAHWSNVTILKGATIDLGSPPVHRGHLKPDHRGDHPKEDPAPSRRSSAVSARGSGPRKNASATPRKDQSLSSNPTTSRRGFIRVFRDDDAENDEIFDLEIEGVNHPSIQDEGDDGDKGGTELGELPPSSRVASSHFKYSRCANALLVVCNNREVMAVSMSGIRSKRRTHSCEESGAFVDGLDVCPFDAPHFLVGCSRGTVHLFAVWSRRPLRDFRWDEANEGLFRSHRLNRVSDLGTWCDGLGELVRFPRSGGERAGGSENRLAWSPGRPSVFVSSGNGIVVVWDLLKSDVAPVAVLRRDEDRPKCTARNILVVKRGADQENAVVFLVHTDPGGVKAQGLKSDQVDGARMEILLKEYFRLC